MRVFTLNSTMLAPAVARELETECIYITPKQFADGEVMFRLQKNLRNEEVCYIQSCYPDQFTSLLQTCFATDLLKKRKASHVTAVIPYLPFQRQDKPTAYESNSARIAIDVLEKSGIDDLYTVDAHSEIALKNYTAFRRNLDPSGCIANYLKNMEFNTPMILAPDDNAGGKVTAIYNLLDHKLESCELLQKTRDGLGKVHFNKSHIKTNAKSAIIVDDVAVDGDTLKGAAEILKRSGVKIIYALITHALLTREAEVELSKVGIRDIISTDSVENKFSKISLAPLIADLFRS